MNIPQYQTVAGLCLPQTTIVPGHVQICIHNTTVEECMAYTQLLEENGFTKYDAREFPAGSDKPYNVNLFYTYVKEDTHIFVYWAASLRMVQIVASHALPLPTVEKPVLREEDNITSTVAQCKLEKGMIYVIQIADGSFILIDGDKSVEEDTKALYDFLLEMTPVETKPRVAMWMFTHPDSDHIQLAADFVKKYAEKVDISAFAYQFPDCDKMQFVYIDSKEIKKDIDTFEENMHRYYPDAVVYTLHAGQIYYFKGFEIEILLTGDTLYPYYYMSGNDVSAAWRVKFDSGKSVMFLGDCMQYACRQLAYTYGDYLKSDIMQITHHGLIGGDIDLYKLIDPEVCLWSTSEKRFLGKLEGQKYQWCIGEGGCDYNRWIRDDSVRARKHYHLGETVILDCTK